MRAAFIKEYATPNQLEYGDLPDPEPKEGEIIVQVKYAGVNYPDTLIIKGLYQFKPELPFSPGGEVSGIVVGLGEGVKGFELGDRVIAAAPFGGFAEKMAVSSHHVYLLPKEVSFEKGSVIQETYATGIHALKDRASLKKGERLLVLGAAGGTGIAAIQIGKLMGAEIVAGASSEEKLSLAKENGADHVINYSDSNLKEELKKLGGVDVIFDPVGGDFAEASFRSLRPGGRHLVIGFTAGAIPALPWNLPLLKQAAIVGVFWGGFWRSDPEGNRKNVDQLLHWVRDEKIIPQIKKVLPLKEAQMALDLIEQRKVLGKIVLKVTED